MSATNINEVEVSDQELNAVAMELRDAYRWCREANISASVAREALEIAEAKASQAKKTVNRLEHKFRCLSCGLKPDEF